MWAFFKMPHSALATITLDGIDSFPVHVHLHGTISTLARWFRWVFFFLCIIWSAQLHYRHKFNTFRAAAGGDIFQRLPWIQRKLSVLCAGIIKVAMMPLSVNGVCTSCGPCSHQKNTATQMSDKERQCPPSWSRFPALNMLNCLLDISIQWEWKGLHFIAQARLSPVIVDSYDSWKRQQSTPCTGKPSQHLTTTLPRGSPGHI